jgi:hypothetical protein
MSIHDVLLAKCEICSGDNQQTRIVFKQLHRKLKFILTHLHSFQKEDAGCPPEI